MMCFRFSRRSCWAGVLACAVMLATAGRTQTAPARVVVPALRRVGPLPVVEAAAEKAQVGFAEIAAGTERTGLRKGDSVTALVSHIDGGKTRQWIVFLKADPPVGAEAAKVPADLMMYSTSGRELRIREEAGAVAIRVIGPFSEGENGAKNAKDRWSGTPVNQAFLALGLDRACETTIRLSALEGMAKNNSPGGVEFGFNSQPFPADKAAINRSVLERLGVTEADERALAGSAPALMSFFQIVGHTQGLEEILRSVLEVSWLSVIKNGGRLEPFLNYLPPFTTLNAADWGLPPEAKCYAFRFQLLLNGKPALNCRLAVTAPRPPLLTSAGIVGLAAQRPDGKGPVLLIQVIDARCGEETDVASGGTSTGAQ